jgi:hypothetical protein
MTKATTNQEIRKVEYARGSVEYNDVYAEILSLGVIRHPRENPSGVAKYSDGAYALYFPSRPIELSALIPLSGRVVALRIEANREVWYKWYEVGNTSNIQGDGNIVATGYFSNNPNKVTLYSVRSENGGFSLIQGGHCDYEAITYENGLELQRTYYEVKKQCVK